MYRLCLAWRAESGLAAAGTHAAEFTEALSLDPDFAGCAGCLQAL